MVTEEEVVHLQGVEERIMYIYIRSLKDAIYTQSYVCTYVYE